MLNFDDRFEIKWCELYTAYMPQPGANPYMPYPQDSGASGGQSYPPYPGAFPPYPVAGTPATTTGYPHPGMPGQGIGGYPQPGNTVSVTLVNAKRVRLHSFLHFRMQTTVRERFAMSTLRLRWSVQLRINYDVVSRNASISVRPKSKH